MRKFVCILLSVVMLLAVLPTQAIAMRSDPYADIFADIGYRIPVEVVYETQRRIERELGVHIVMPPPEPQGMMSLYYRPQGSEITLTAEESDMVPEYHHLRALSELLGWEVVLRRINPELLAALAQYWRSRGMTLRLDNYGMEAREAAGHYVWGSGRIEIHANRAAFGHEFGHMVHCVIRDLYGREKFRREWIAAGGRDVPDYYEDVADDIGGVIYGLYVDPGYVVEDEMLLFLQRVSNEIFGTDMFIVYEQQVPSAWAADSVARWHEGQQQTRQTSLTVSFGSGAYQQPINRWGLARDLYNLNTRTEIARTGQSIDPWAEFAGQYVHLHGVYGRLRHVFEWRGIVLHPFRDVNLNLDDNMGCPIVFVYDNGIMSGTDTHTFNPYGFVTREQLAAIIMRMARHLELPEPTGTYQTPTDNAQVSSWAREGVEFVLRAGLMSGTGGGNFNPQGQVTHEQVYVILQRLFEQATATVDTTAVSSRADFAIAHGNSAIGSPALTWNRVDVPITNNAGYLHVHRNDPTRPNVDGLAAGNRPRFPDGTEVLWETSDPSVIRFISNNSIVDSVTRSSWQSTSVQLRPMSVGTATVTATANGETASFTVNVRPTQLTCNSCNHQQIFTARADIPRAPGGSFECPGCGTSGFDVRTQIAE